MNKPKRLLRNTFFISVLLFLLTLGSCDMFINWFGTTIEDRVEAFNDDLEAKNWGQLYKHFHNDTEDRSIMDETYWVGTALHDEGSITSYSISGETVNGMVWNGTVNKSFNMDMKKDGLDYYIRRLDIEGNPEIKKLD